MKTLLNIGVLLVSMSALASPSDPTLYQYWLDADQQSRNINTRAYNASSNSLTIDVGSLSEGGHALHYRMATEDEGKVMWGKPVSKYFYVPIESDKSNSTPTAYRIIVNNDVVEQGQVSGGSSFTISPTFPENRVLSFVSDREFKYKNGTKNVSMTANGTFTYAVQLMSDQKEWGAPFFKEISDLVTTDLPYDSIQVPERYTFDKVNNNNFKAYRFKNDYSDYLYITPSQDCKVSFYYVSDGYQGNLGGIDSYQLRKDETTRVNTGSRGSDVMAIFYDTPIDKDNSASVISLDIMLEDHQVAKPVIRLDPDTWEMTITCPDQRATIFYTLDGSKASTSGTVYTGPVILDKFTRVRAIAVVGGYDDSEEEDMQYGSAHLRIPVPELKYAGGLDKNEFIFTNRVDGVTTYYAFGYNSDLEDEGLRIPFDGNPFKIEDGVFLKAYSVKDNLADSEPFGNYIYLRDYVARSPYLYDHRSEGEDYEWYSDRKEMFKLSVPEGTAYYRILPGKQTFDPAEEIVKDQWTLYNQDVNDGWIELPGGANSGNQTVQVYAESEDKAPSAVTDIYVDWVRAKSPRIDYNNYKLKLFTDVPGGMIKYNLGYYNPDDAKVYTEEEFPDGIDVKEQWLVTAFVEAEGYNTSSAPQINRDSYNISSPTIEYQEDGYLHVYQNDEGVSLRLEIVPAQSYEPVSENHIRFIPQYNTTIKAQAVKHGKNDSDFSEKTHCSKPVINVDGYRVWFDEYWYDMYYTTDGSMPTKESTRYEGEFYVDKACTVNAVRFDDGQIPSLAEPAKVLDQTVKPEMEFNFSIQQTEEGPKEIRKIRLSCSTNNSRIYYSLGRGVSDDSRTLYDPSEWEGIDVGTNNYVYAYAEADDYRRSEEVSFDMRDGYLSTPQIEVKDGVVEIWHDDPNVTIVPEFTPWQEYTYVHDDENNKVTCTVAYDSQVKAHVEKPGYIPSDNVEREPCSKPQIYVDEYRVWMDESWYEIYYTIDGSTPTKESSRYEGEFYVDKACTVNAVRFEDGSIPSLAESKKVMDRAETPLLTFNFDKSKDQKKVYLSCNTPNAKIYYTLDRSLNEDTRKEYKQSETPEGIDVAGYNYIYVYAEADGYRRSEEMSRYLEEGILGSPNIEVKNDGEIIISHADPTVTIIPTFTDGNGSYTPADYTYTHNEESNIITATVRPNTFVKAYASKPGYFDSSDSDRGPYSIPTINVDGYYVWIDNSYGEVFYTLDGTAPTKESKYYESGFDATPCTVRAVCYIDGEIPGEATPAKVMDPAQVPVAVFNYSTQMVEGEEGTEPEEVTIKKIKFTCSTPNAKIYYSVGRSINDNTKTLYDPATLGDGVDVSDYSYVYAFAEAEGYRRSETVSISTSDGYLSRPEIQVVEGVVEIWHNDPDVIIVPVFTPEQQYEYVKDGTTNKVTCKVLNNTSVKAHVEKAGCFASDDVERVSLDQPTINIEDNRVYIDHYWRDEVYYTLDGSAPTKQSQRFDDNWFEVDPCTIKAVAFRDGEIPAEAEPAVVLPQVATPKMVYNFDRSKNQRKIKFSCDTQNAKIYYALNKGITEQNRETYDPSSDGVDVTDMSYVYVYAEADGFRRSVETDYNFGDAYLGTPEIQVTGDGVVEIRHSDPSVKIVPTFTAGTETYTPEDLVYTQDAETNKITATVKYNTVVKAHVEKDGYYASDDNQYDPLPQPIINVDGYYVWFDNNYGEIYYTLDGSMPTRKSSYYDGGFNATAGTVRAVCFWEGSIPSEAAPGYVQAQAVTPQVVFNFSKTEVDGEVKDVKKVKFASETPNAKVYYSADAPLNSNTRILYDPATYPDGIDVSEISYVYAQAVADGYRDSEISERVYMSEGLLNAPEVSISDGVVTITHNDPSVTIVPVITPVQDYAYDHTASTNKITFNVAYNSSIKAYVTKTGYLDSDQVSASYVDKPIINVSDYYVDIDTHGYDYYTYYTTDGTLPTKESIPYTGGFESSACTIRAAILIDGYIPMEADQAKVMDPAVNPVIEIDNGFAKISTTTPGATIWYVTDVNISNANRKAYNPAELPNGIDLSSVRTINTYAEAEGYRRSETVNFEKNNFLLSAPSLSYSNGYVSAEVYDDNVAVKFTDGNGKELTPESNNAFSVKIPYNTVVNAYTYKKGYLNSSSTQIKCTDAPTITADLFKITIKGKSGQTLRYTTDGSTPTASSKEYEGPFNVTESCKVRAVAFVDNLIPAEGQSIDIAYRKSLKPEVQSYNGRYLTLSAENGSTIKYVVGSNADISQAAAVEGKIDLEGINVIKAIAHRDDADDSDVFTFTPEYYANETDVYTSKAGMIKKAFDWCPDKSIYTSLNVHGVIIGSETEDNGDYAFLRALPELRHLDLSNVTDAAIPDSAFASKKLISVVLPASFKTVGEKLFGEDNTTLCAVEIPGDGFVPDTLLNGVKNPNLLLYLKNKNAANDLLEKVGDVIKNVVVLGSLNSSNRAENVVLTHANAFYAPKEFNAQKISFTRSFTKETPIGGFGSGWETMVVPFDVQSVSCASKVLKPFGEADTERGECPFWLFSAADTDWQSEASIFANTPYLLAFPNNPLYADEYVVNGDVVFSSNNATVPVTPVEDDMMFGFGMGRYIVGNYETINKEEDVLAINDEVYNYHNTDFQPGGIFVAGQKDVAPFECFVWTENGVSGLPVFEQSAIDGVMYETGVKVWSESYDIYIYSGIAMKARIYDSVGQLIRSVDVKAGDTVRVQDITPGIYFVGNTKILVKK